VRLPAALLLGGDQIAVSAARSIAALDVEIHAVGLNDAPIQSSRVCSSFTMIPGGPGLSDRYLDWLERGPRGAVLLPCDDESLEVVARHRRTLEGWGYHPIEADDDVVLAMLDKERTYALSRAAGVPTPMTMTLGTRRDAEEATQTFKFPCALKPRTSHPFAQRVGISTKAYVAHDAEELMHWFDVAGDLGIEMLVTEIVPGDDEAFCSYYSYFLPDGSPLFHLTKHKLRQFPIGFGLTCYQETVWEPAVAEMGLRFCQAVGLRGVANVEFKRDARKGAWKIIECNPRFTRANELVRLAGIDIPAIAYRRVAGLEVEPLRGYRLGVRMWSPIEDAQAFLRYRTARKLTFAGWVRSLLCRWHFPVWRLDDPIPTLRVLICFRSRMVTRGLLRRFRERIGGGAGA